MAPRSTLEEARLALALPELKALEARLRSDAASSGIEYIIPSYGGVRTPEEQAQLVAWRDEADLKADGRLGADTLGWYPVASLSSGFHPIGGAFDVRVVRWNGATYSRDKNTAPDAAYRALADIGKRIGLRPGYYFTRKDEFHFELNKPRADVEAAWNAHKAAAVKSLGGVLALLVVTFLLVRHP